MEVQLLRFKGADDETLAKMFGKALSLSVPRIDESVRGRALCVQEVNLPGREIVVEEEAFMCIRRDADPQEQPVAQQLVGGALPFFHAGDPALAAGSIESQQRC